MKRLLEISQEYIKTMSIRDMALIKICLYSAGILMGLSIPLKCRKIVSVAACAIFIVTYLLAMLPFLKMLQEKSEHSCD